MLSCSALSVAVPGRLLCRDLALEFRAGERWAVLGVNGSGKTSLLHTLGGLRPAQAGRVELAGRALAAYRPRERARRLGMLLQEEAPGFWGNVLEYALLGRYPHAHSWFGWGGADEERALAALRRFDLEGLGGRALDTLSGGERQRARLALLLVQDPEVYLLDEPLQHLDLRHQLAALEVFSGLAQGAGRAVVMVLHDPRWAVRYCDQALLLFEDGTTLAGPVVELLVPATLERLYGCRVA